MVDIRISEGKECCFNCEYFKDPIIEHIVHGVCVNIDVNCFYTSRAFICDCYKRRKEDEQI